jgi:thiol-disulfide isomerase/thioredoxin
MSSRASRSRPARRSASSTVAPKRTPEQARRRWLWWVLPTAAVAAVVVLAVISSTRSTSGGGESARVTETPAAGGPGSNGAPGGSGQVGEQLASSSLTSIDGQPVKVPSGKPGAVFFMAGWCATCYPEATALGELERRLGDRIAVLAVSPDPSDSVSAIRQFRSQAGNPRYPFAWDQQSTLARALEVSALDTTVVYDAGGKVVFRDAVPTDAETLEQAFRKAGVS